MKTEKMSFKNIKDVLSRDEMKAIVAGSGGSICTISYQYNSGESISYTGGCPGNNAQCTTWGGPICSNFAYSGSGSCTIACSQNTEGF